MSDNSKVFKIHITVNVTQRLITKSYNYMSVSLASLSIWMAGFKRKVGIESSTQNLLQSNKH